MGGPYGAGPTEASTGRAIRAYSQLYEWTARRCTVAAFDDLTARARIREAAMHQFAEHGFERTTIRGIAAAAGVSGGLVRHHYGSKQELKDAVDEHVAAEIRRISDEMMVAGERGDLAPSVVSREA